ncbi:MAG TPA: hypothetical protein VGC76_09165 [Pyrinomonadaceae bacterium]|jgi:hypothetical protein
MSEKKRQKKDGEGKNKNNQRMRAANDKDTGAKNGIDTREDDKSAGKSKN